MPLGIDRMLVRKAQYDSTRMTDLAHWSKMSAVVPEVFESLNRTLFASKTASMDLANGNIIEAMYGMGKTKYIDDLHWSWKMDVKGSRPLTILENLDSGITTPGVGQSDIRLRVDSDFAAIGESWSAGVEDKSQVLRVVSKERAGDSGFIYIMKTYTEGLDHYINPKYLEAGQQWSRMFTFRGEAAESGGHTEKTTNVEFSNYLNKLRKEYRVTDYGAQAKLQIALMNSRGQKIFSWMDMQQAEYQQQLNREVANAVMWSRIGEVPYEDSDSKYLIKTGAGIQQQIEFGGHVEHYSTLTVELLEAFILRIIYSRMNPKDLGVITMQTGLYGMYMFNKVLAEWTKNNIQIVNSDILMSRNHTGLSKNSLTVGFAFTEYLLPIGGAIRAIYNPMYDDKQFSKEIDPITGFPKGSLRYTFTDVTGGGSGMDTTGNIFLVRKNKVAGTTVIPGRVGPGGSLVQNATHSGDWYEVHMSDSVGVQITDPTITGELIKV